MLRGVPWLTYSCPCFLQVSALGSPHLCGLWTFSHGPRERPILYGSVFCSFSSLRPDIFTCLLAFCLSSPKKDQAILFVHSFPPLSEPSITSCCCAKSNLEERGMRASERAPLTTESFLTETVALVNLSFQE